MTLQTLLALNHSAPLAVRLLLEIPVTQRHRLLLRDMLAPGSVSQYNGFNETIIAAHPETWAAMKQKAMPLREQFVALVERGGAA